MQPGPERVTLVWSRRRADLCDVRCSRDPSGEFVVVGAHYDSRPFWDEVHKASAPGAEDNGSGVASLLLMANAVKDVPTDRSIVFVAFTGEEEGLIGSTAFVRKAKELLAPSLIEGGNLGVVMDENPIHSAIILDEVAFKQDGHNYAVTLETHENSRTVMDHLAQSNKVHNKGELETVFSFEAFGSDHMPFLDKQDKAVLTINAGDSLYTQYHKSTDTIDYVDPKLGFMITKMDTGAILRLACE